ncbi:hypothetical protein BDZ45DRAFT_694719 [Acephala macrosclerotiorum]|nr:hypothetical protein BDZ45DRAFT_694719 [Acephala macrosclerotiorum]
MSTTPPAKKIKTASKLATPPPSTSKHPSRRTKKGILHFRGPQTFVTIIVGAEKEKFSVLKQLISHHSPFFEAAFDSNFIEGKTRAMVLVDVEPDIFSLLVNWLYLQKLQHSDGRPVVKLELAKLWNLAEYCLMPRLQNEAMPAIYSGGPRNWNVNLVPDNDDIFEGLTNMFVYIYGTTNSSSLLKAVCLEYLIGEWSRERTQEKLVDKLYETLLGPGSALDMIRKLRALKADYSSHKLARLSEFLVKEDDDEKRDEAESGTEQDKMFREHQESYVEAEE